MDELAALRIVGELVSTAGDDAAVVDELVLTIDMLHERTDFPAGTTDYTAGWRAVGASLSDVAAMGASATATVSGYGAPSFEETALREFVAGATDVSTQSGARYVGGDLDEHEEFTVATAAVGETAAPVFRTGASEGDVVCVTGALGRTAAAIRYFENGDPDRGNELFRFDPRVAAGTELAVFATAMMDSSDGLARSLHQLGAASDVGFSIDSEAIPIHDALDVVEAAERSTLAVTYGEDFELVCTMPETEVMSARERLDVPLSVIGHVEPADEGITMDGEPLADTGWTHGT
jgi:thiamine-monophosphate kinase